MPQTPDEFLRLLQPNYCPALQYCRALCRDPNNAQDLLQQALVLALEKLPGLRDPNCFKSWFFKIITRTFYRQNRQKFWRQFLPLDALAFGSPDKRQPALPPVFLEPDEPINERRSRLLAALAQLRPKERAALLLFELGNFTVAEIAEIQEEKSISAVKSRLSRSRHKLKALIPDAERKNLKIQSTTKDLSDETEKLAALFPGRR